jgi:hypothetical protein
VNVSPSTRSGRTIPFATSQTSRAAIVSLLPEPAPAITAIGASGAAITAACSAVGAAAPSSRASWAGLYLPGVTKTSGGCPSLQAGEESGAPRGGAT